MIGYVTNSTSSFLTEAGESPPFEKSEPAKKAGQQQDEGQQRMKVVKELTLWKYSVFRGTRRRGCVFRERERTGKT